MTFSLAVTSRSSEIEVAGIVLEIVVARGALIGEASIFAKDVLRPSIAFTISSGSVNRPRQFPSCC